MSAIPSADIVAHAIVAASRKFGRDPIEIMGDAESAGGPRILAAAALDRAGYGPRPLLARACALGSMTYFYPSQGGQ